MFGGDITITKGFENNSMIFSSVSVGRNHTCAVEIDGHGNNLFCWGRIQMGKLEVCHRHSPWDMKKSHIRKMVLGIKSKPGVSTHVHSMKQERFIAGAREFMVNLEILNGKESISR